MNDVTNTFSSSDYSCGCRKQQARHGHELGSCSSSGSAISSVTWSHQCDLPESQCPHLSIGNNTSILNVTRKKREEQGKESGRIRRHHSPVNMHLISLPLLLALLFTEHSASLNPFLCPPSSASLSISFLFNNNNEEQEKN